MPQAANLDAVAGPRSGISHATKEIKLSGKKTAACAPAGGRNKAGRNREQQPRTSRNPEMDRIGQQSSENFTWTRSISLTPARFLGIVRRFGKNALFRVSERRGS
jgi:hypothetical protein